MRVFGGTGWTTWWRFSPRAASGFVVGTPSLRRGPVSSSALKKWRPPAKYQPPRARFALHEPAAVPPGFGVRQSSGAFRSGPRAQKRQRTAAVQDASAPAAASSRFMVPKHAQNWELDVGCSADVWFRLHRAAKFPD